MSGTAPSGDVTSGQQPPTLIRRLGTAVLLVAEIIAVPVLVGLVVGGPRVAFGLAIGSLTAFMVSSAAGWQGAVRLLPIVLVVVGFAAWSAHTAWWAVLLTLIGLTVGLASQAGWSTPFAFMGIIATIAQPVTTTGDLLLLVGFAALGFGYGAWLSRQLGLARSLEGFEVPAAQAVLLGVGLGAVAGAAGAIALAWGVDHAYWLPMTVFILSIPAAGAALGHRVLHRVLGTLAGVPVGVLLLAVGLPAGVNALVGSLALIVALAVPVPRWRSAAFISAAIVLLLDNGNSDPDLAWERVGATVLGALLLVAGAAAIVVVGRLLRDDPTTEDLAQGFEVLGGPHPGDAPGPGRDGAHS